MDNKMKPTESYNPKMETMLRSACKVAIVCSVIALCIALSIYYSTESINVITIGV